MHKGLRIKPLRTYIDNLHSAVKVCCPRFYKTEGRAVPALVSQFWPHSNICATHFSQNLCKNWCLFSITPVSFHNFHLFLHGLGPQNQGNWTAKSLHLCFTRSLASSAARPPLAKPWFKAFAARAKGQRSNPESWLEMEKGLTYFWRLPNWSGLFKQKYQVTHIVTAFDISFFYIFSTTLFCWLGGRTHVVPLSSM